MFLSISTGYLLHPSTTYFIRIQQRYANSCEMCYTPFDSTLPGNKFTTLDVPPSQPRGAFHVLTAHSESALCYTLATKAAISMSRINLYKLNANVNGMVSEQYSFTNPSPEFEVCNVPYGVNVSFQVTAANSRGFGPASDVMVFSSVPLPPRNVVVAVQPTVRPPGDPPVVMVQIASDSVTPIMYCVAVSVLPTSTRDDICDAVSAADYRVYKATNPTVYITGHELQTYYVQATVQTWYEAQVYHGNSDVRSISRAPECMTATALNATSLDDTLLAGDMIAIRFSAPTNGVALGAHDDITRFVQSNVEIAAVLSARWTTDARTLLLTVTAPSAPARRFLQVRIHVDGESDGIRNADGTSLAIMSDCRFVVGASELPPIDPSAPVSILATEAIVYGLEDAVYALRIDISSEIQNIQDATVVISSATDTCQLAFDGTCNQITVENVALLSAEGGVDLIVSFARDLCGSIPFITRLRTSTGVVLEEHSSVVEVICVNDAPEFIAPPTSIHISATGGAQNASTWTLEPVESSLEIADAENDTVSVSVSIIGEGAFVVLNGIQNSIGTDTALHTHTQELLVYGAVADVSYTLMHHIAFGAVSRANITILLILSDNRAPSTTTLLQVIFECNTLSTPLAMTAVLATSLDAIVLTFSPPVFADSTALSCMKIFDNSTMVLFGANATCVVAADATLAVSHITILPSPEHGELDLGASIVLLSSGTRLFLCDMSTPVPPLTTPLRQPEQAVPAPTLRLQSTTQTTGACDNVHIFGIARAGIGLWPVQYFWDSDVGLDLTDATNTELFIPSTVLVAAITATHGSVSTTVVTFTLRASNYFGSVGIASIHIAYNNTAVPAPSSGTVPSDVEIACDDDEIVFHVPHALCGDVTMLLVYEWTLESDMNGTSSGIRIAGSWDSEATAKLTIARRELQAHGYQQTYHLHLRVYAPQSFAMTHTVIKLSVVCTNAIVIDGGSRQVKNADSDIVLKTRYKNNFPSAGDDVSCAWTCSQLPAQRPCRYAPHGPTAINDPSKALSTIGFTNNCTLVIVAQDLAQGYYNIGVTAIDQHGAYVHAVRISLQPLNINVNIVATVRKEHITKIAPADTLALQAIVMDPSVVQGGGSMSYQWTLTGVDTATLGPPLELRRQNLTIFNTRGAPLFARGSTVVASVVVTCIVAGVRRSGTSTVELAVKAAPSGGTCAVEPRKTTFTGYTIRSFGWVSDAALSYAFLVRVAGVLYPLSGGHGLSPVLIVDVLPDSPSAYDVICTVHSRYGDATAAHTMEVNRGEWQLAGAMMRGAGSARRWRRSGSAPYANVNFVELVNQSVQNASLRATTAGLLPVCAVFFDAATYGNVSGATDVYSILFDAAVELDTLFQTAGNVEYLTGVAQSLHRYLDGGSTVGATVAPRLRRAVDYLLSAVLSKPAVTYDFAGGVLDLIDTTFAVTHALSGDTELCTQTNAAWHDIFALLSRVALGSDAPPSTGDTLWFGDKSNITATLVYALTHVVANGNRYSVSVDDGTGTGQELLLSARGAAATPTGALSTIFVGGSSAACYPTVVPPSEAETTGELGSLLMASAFTDMETTNHDVTISAVFRTATSALSRGSYANTVPVCYAYTGAWVRTGRAGLIGTAPECAALPVQRIAAVFHAVPKPTTQTTQPSTARVGDQGTFDVTITIAIDIHLYSTLSPAVQTSMGFSLAADLAHKISALQIGGESANIAWFRSGNPDQMCFNVTLSYASIDEARRAVEYFRGASVQTRIVALAAESAGRAIIAAGVDGAVGDVAVTVIAVTSPVLPEDLSSEGYFATWHIVLVAMGITLLTTLLCCAAYWHHRKRARMRDLKRHRDKYNRAFAAVELANGAPGRWKKSVNTGFDVTPSTAAGHFNLTTLTEILNQTTSAQRPERPRVPPMTKTHTAHRRMSIRSFLRKSAVAPYTARDTTTATQARRTHLPSRSDAQGPFLDMHHTREISSRMTTRAPLHVHARMPARRLSVTLFDMDHHTAEVQTPAIPERSKSTLAPLFKTSMAREISNRITEYAPVEHASSTRAASPRRSRRKSTTLADMADTDQCETTSHKSSEDIELHMQMLAWERELQEANQAATEQLDHSRMESLAALQEKILLRTPPQDRRTPETVRRLMVPRGGGLLFGIEAATKEIQATAARTLTNDAFIARTGLEHELSRRLHRQWTTSSASSDVSFPISEGSNGSSSGVARTAGRAIEENAGRIQSQSARGGGVLYPPRNSQA